MRRDCSIFFRSGLDFLLNIGFLYDLKTSLKKVKPQIKNINKNQKKILVDCYPTSLLYVYALLIHTFPIQKNFNSDCVIYSSNFSFTKSYLFSVLDNYQIVYLDLFIKNIFVIIKNFKILKSEFSKIQKIKENHYDYKFDGIELGKIGYDNYLRKQKYGKVRNLSIYKYHVFLSLIQYLNVKKLIEKNIFVYSGKEAQFLPRALILQTCLKNSIKSFLVWGPHDEFSIRKYSHFSQRYFARNYINKHDFINKINKNSVQRGKKYIENKFFSKIQNVSTNDKKKVTVHGAGSTGDTMLAFNANLKKLNKNNFLKKLGLDKEKKTVVIFSHCSFDGVLESPRIMFNDFYSWLEETILVLVKNHKINVIIKPHPREQQWGSLNMCKEIYEKHDLKNIKHIKLIDNEFHPTTLLEVMDFNITARGTVGPEYAAFNVPCISVDHTPYNYCSFNYNFKDKNNYLKQLKDLPAFIVRNHSRHTVDAYHYLNLSFYETRVKNPYFPGSDNIMPKNYSIIEESSYLKKCINLIKISNSENKKYFYGIYKNYFKNNKYTLFKNI